MSYPSEMLPYGSDPSGMFNWVARDQSRRSAERSGTEPEGTAISEVLSKTRHVRLGNGDYYGGSIFRQKSELPVVVSGNPSKTMVKSPIRVEESSVHISGLTFVATGNGAPVLDVARNSTVTVTDCIFKFVSTTDNHTVVMDDTCKLVINGCHFYGGSSTPRIVDNPGVLANLIISMSYRGYGSAWSASFTGIGNI